MARGERSSEGRHFSYTLEIVCDTPGDDLLIVAPTVTLDLVPPSIVAEIGRVLGLCRLPVVVAPSDIDGCKPVFSCWADMSNPPKASSFQASRSRTHVAGGHPAAAADTGGSGLASSGGDQANGSATRGDDTRRVGWAAAGAGSSPMAPPTNKGDSGRHSATHSLAGQGPHGLADGPITPGSGAGQGSGSGDGAAASAGTPAQAVAEGRAHHHMAPRPMKQHVRSRSYGGQRQRNDRPPFVVIVTASTRRQADAIADELRWRVQQRMLPPDTLVFAVPDPENARVGSGGATLNALLTVADLMSGHGELGLHQCKVFMIHSGGDSQRNPAASVCGKAWCALPTIGTHVSGALLCQPWLVCEAANSGHACAVVCCLLVGPFESQIRV